MSKLKVMSNEKSMKHLTEMYGQTLSGVKLLSKRLKATSLGRVLEIYAGLPFVQPIKSPVNQDEVILLQGLIKLADLRTAMLDLVGEDGKVKEDEKTEST